MTFDEMAATGTIDVSADPVQVYELIANVVRVGEFSPECITAEWAGDLAEPKVGEKFNGTNKIGDFEWTTTSEITAADPGARFAWTVDGGADDGPAAYWSYDLEPIEGGTRVTESFQIGASKGGFRRFGKNKTDEENAAMAASRVEQLTASIATTLANLKAVAES